jgi:hypothetical protein
MTNSNLSETVDNINILNVNIREVLIEVLPVVSPELQLEITLLLRQIYHINSLIEEKNHSWVINHFKFNDKRAKFILLLEDIRSILIVLKTNKVSVESIREFRINLEKEINCDRYLFWGNILNLFIHIYYIKSIPFKIFIGLSVTTLFAIIALVLSAQEIYKLDVSLLENHLEQQTNIVTSAPPSASPLPSPKRSDNLVSPIKRNNPSRRILYSLVYAATAGVLGSVASILLRIIDFRDQQYDDPFIPFFIGLCKPLIGLILGIFSFSLISSNTVIKIDFLITQDNNSSTLNDDSSTSIENNIRHNLFIFSCAFLVGFSERFASDLLKKTESSIIEKKS